jgi:hypothetical protein
MNRNELEQAIDEHILAGARESVWFRSAPEGIQSTLKVLTIGLETHVRSSRYGGDSEALPVLVAEVECGEETRRFAFSLGSARDMG